MGNTETTVGLGRACVEAEQLSPRRLRGEAHEPVVDGAAANAGALHQLGQAALLGGGQCKPPLEVGGEVLGNGRRGGAEGLRQAG